MGHKRSVALLVRILILLALSLVTSGCPYPCTCTDFKVDCYSKGLTEIPDNFPPNVVSIDLQYNKIENIGDQFHNLTSLQEVMLRFNRISHLADGTFSDLPRLKHINLGSNLITNLSANAFQNVPQMSILDLTDNRLTIVDGSFEGLSSLTKLVLTRNLIEELTEDSLKPLINLVYFMADENQIAHVHPAAFHPLEKLSFVSLIKNPLHTMDDVLSSNAMLSYLNLDDCQLTNVPTGLPWATRNLQLRRNNITTISSKTFMPTQYLGVIMLDDNRINHVEPGAFTPIIHLQELWLSGNQLSALPAPIPSTVQTLSMENNDITTVSNEDFPHDSQMKTLSLKGNKINRIDPFTFSRLAALQKLYLSDNNITELQDKSFFGMRNLTRLEVDNNPIQHIDIRFAAGLHKLDILDLSYVEDSEPFIEGNFFRDIPFLKTLHLRSSPFLAHHVLTSNETLKSFYNLEELDVRDNNLQSLDTDLPRFFSNLQRLRLAGNAWVCDPRLLWLHDWMQTSRNIFTDVEGVVCAVPMHLAGSIIADLPYHAFFYTTTTSTTSTTTEESAGSGDLDYTIETDSGQAAELTTISDLVTLVIDFSTENNQPDTNPQTTVNFSTSEGHTDQGLIPDEFYTTADMEGYRTDSTTTETTKKTGATTTTTNVPPSTSTQDDTNDTAEKSSHVKGHTTAATAKKTTSTVPSKEETTTERMTTSTTLSSTSGKQTTESPQTTVTPTFPSPTSPSVSTASDTSTTTTHKPTGTPRYGGSKTTSEVRSSLTRTIIIATCIAGTALIIVIIALVVILRHKRKIRLVFHRALTSRTQRGDTEFVLSDQDDSSPECNQMTEMSESEQGSTPSEEIASDDGLRTKLV